MATVGRISALCATLLLAVGTWAIPAHPAATPSEFVARISVDSGNIPFHVVLLKDDSPYLARREAMRAGSVRFPGLEAGTYRVLIELPGGKRVERLLEIDAYHAGSKREVRLRVTLQDFLIAPHCLTHELSVNASAFCVEQDVMGMLRSSWKLIEQGDMAAAHARLRLAVTLDPEFHEGWINLGLVAQSQGSLLEAVQCYKEALRQDAGCFVANTNLSAVLSSLGRYDEALHFGYEAIRAHPESLFAHRNQAILHLSQRQYGQAIPHLEKVIALNGRHTDSCRLQLAIAHAELQQYRAAIAVFQEWMRLFPHHPRFQTVEAATLELTVLSHH